MLRKKSSEKSSRLAGALDFEGVNPKMVRCCVLYVYKKISREYREPHNAFLPTDIRLLHIKGRFGQSVPRQKTDEENLPSPRHWKYPFRRTDEIINTSGGAWEIWWVEHTEIMTGYLAPHKPLKCAARIICIPYYSRFFM